MLVHFSKFDGVKNAVYFNVYTLTIASGGLMWQQPFVQKHLFISHDIGSQLTNETGSSPSCSCYTRTEISPSALNVPLSQMYALVE